MFQFTAVSSEYRTTMNHYSIIVICIVTLFGTARSADSSKKNDIAGYVQGHVGMPPIDESFCMNDILRENPDYLNPLECARECHKGDTPKICYYAFVLERYPVNGQACNFCQPNITNSICANCQCVPGDGVDRMGLTVNRMIPGPSIQACLGDYIVVDVVNLIKDDGVTIHWHGIFQNGHQYYDGVPSVTQCPITFPNSFRYQFQLKNSGTHFWHAHTALDKMDGIFGSFIVREPIEDDLSGDLYDTDFSSHVIVINDWMHEETTERFPGRSTGVVGQLPDSTLINGKGRFMDANGVHTNTSLEVITVDVHKRHRFRLVNSYCGTCPGLLTIEGHNMTVIATDGKAVEPTVVTSILSFAAERYDFVINTDQKPGSYWIQLRLMGACASKGVQQLAILQYANVGSGPASPAPSFNNSLPMGITLNPLNGNCEDGTGDAVCVYQLRYPVTDETEVLKPEADVKFYLPVRFRAFTPSQIFQPNVYHDFLIPAPGVNVAATVDGITYQFPPSPPLSQIHDIPPSQFCNSSSLPSSCNNNCSCTHLLDIELNSVVELIMIDETRAGLLNHPFHLHGYAYRVLTMGQPLGPSGGNSTPITVDYVKQLDASGQLHRNLKNPPAKDTLPIPNNGYYVIRFRANNPGYWLFHCHFVFHQVVGMELVFHVGTECDLPDVPDDFPKCANYMNPIVFDPSPTYDENGVLRQENWADNYPFL